jgi:hypothetical protein
MWRYVGAAAAALALLAGGSAQGARLVAPANTSLPTISGTPRAGETLTAASGAWSGTSPISFAYRWQRCDKNGNSCNNTSATNQAYTLQKGDAGRRLRVSVTASNSDGSANAVSAPSAVVAAGLLPENTSLPAISGTAKAGSTLTASTGTWKNNPTSFTYQWRRCSAAGNNCNGAGAKKNTYELTGADVGATIRVRVRARNQFGDELAQSAQTAVVAAAGPLPANTVLPVIGGVARNGQVLVASAGSWANSPNHFDYQWQRCDTGGNNCNGFGADASSQRLTSTEVGHRIRVTVSARNQFGITRATSAPTAVVTGAGPASIGVDQVSLPNQLVITGVRFVPRRLHSRQAFVGRFRVSDARGNLVRGAIVYAIGIPYGWVRPAPEVVTAGNGWATIQFFPTRLMPLHRAALVFFVRARKPGERLLSGVSTRRLVQVGIG